MTDSYKHKGLRKKLIETIRSKGIRDEKVLKAIEAIPRHYFLDSSFVEYAYQDTAFQIGSGQTISQPYTVAFQTELLQVEKGHKVLEIGTGSGYQACVLAELGAKVFTIERQKNLHVRTKAFLPKFGYRIRAFFGDGYEGLPTYAPFDRILVTAGAPYIPEELLSQLKPGGILVIPVGDTDNQIMTCIKRINETDFTQTDYGTCRFVPLLENVAND